MKRVLIFGDTHIPTRRTSIPEGFYKHISNTHYDLGLITGDLVREQDMRSALPPLPRCHVVMGNMDYGRGYSFHETVQVEDFKFLLIHGTQLRPRGNLEQLWEITMEVGADVAVHGHTHKSEVTLHKNRLLLNPGTLSGATGGWSGRTDASFIELEVSKKQIEVTLHLTDWHIEKTSRIVYCKTDAGIVIPC
ncbi:MAG: YfcE family phosphodiesterase [Candidatus Thorarchaeota archaeon]|nr:YfcE family phosphodiesterase [Candidatus Thorarchaeota archaeon]